MAGIGKTTLAAKLIEDYRNSKHLFWHEFHEMDAIRGILLKLAGFLTKLGDDHLELFLRTRTGYDHYEISRILEKSIKKLDTILIFDDFQKSSDEIRKFFVYFLGMLSPSSNTKMIILSREIVPFYDSRDVLAKKRVGELGLEGLDFESSKKILREKGISKGSYKDIYGFTAGNPLFLEVYQSGGHLDRFVHDELFSRLGENEQRIMGYLSIFRFPISQGPLRENEMIDFETLYILTTRSLLKMDTQNRYFIHDIIKRFFYTRLSKSTRKGYHNDAAKWFVKQDNSEDLCEAIYHYQEAGEIKSATDLVIKHSDSIINDGYASEFLTIIERFDERDLVPEIYADVLFIKSRSNHIMGDWKKALQYYNECSDLATLSNDNKLKINSICQAGYILEEQNELEKSLETFKKGLNLSKKDNYPFGLADSFRGIGRFYWRTSHHTKAIFNYKKCLEISEKENFDDLSGSTYIDLGNTYDEKCEISKAIECYEKSITYLRNTNNIKETGRAYGNLGVTLRHFEDYKNAIKYHKMQLDLIKKSQYMRCIGYGYAWIGYCDVKIDDYKNAKKYAKKAEDIALKIENNNILFDVYKIYAYILARKNEWEKAMHYFQKSLDGAVSSKSFFPAAETHFEIGQLYQKAGKGKEAEKQFILASNLYKKLGLDKSQFIRSKMESVGMNFT
jgi:tetratricopeptide (TPR) repeat protein